MELDDIIDATQNQTLLQKVRRGAKDFAIDTAANVLYWQPVLAISEYGFMGFSAEEVIDTHKGSIVFSVTMGGVYGRVLDAGRYLFHRDYFNEVRHGIEREDMSKKELLKDFTVDTLTTSVFWNGVMAPWLHYVSGLSWERVGEAALAYTAVYAVASAPYGKFLNWFREKCE